MATPTASGGFTPIEVPFRDETEGFTPFEVIPADHASREVLVTEPAAPRQPRQPRTPKPEPVAATAQPETADTAAEKEA